MATIAKFYLLDATSSNTGTMPSNSPATISGNVVDGDATGAATARDTSDVAGTANPDTESLVTATANTLAQTWGHRRYVSEPLAAHTFALGDGNWTFSYARTESNTNHNGRIICQAYAWDPAAGARVGTANQKVFLTGAIMSVAAETADSTTSTWTTSLTISNGNILVFDVYTVFTQGMGVAYTENFAYNGTTEASTTTCASFVAPPAPLTLFTAAAPGLPFQFDPVPFVAPGRI